MFTRLKNYVTPILIILHVVGAVGIIWFPEANMKSISSLNLLTSLGLILLPAPIHQLWRKIGVVFLLGMAVEILGVATGYPFGTYHYGEALGQKIAGVPIVIGLNWFMTAYISYHVAKGFIAQKLLRIIASTVLMLLLDMLIEPVAPKLDYWYWADNTIPSMNFVSWYLVGLVCVYIIDANHEESLNPSARNLFFIQLVFFALLNLFL